MKWLIPALSSLFILFALCVFPHTSYAFDVFGNACSAGGGDSAVCQETGSGKNTTNPLVGSDGLLIKVANIIAVVAGIIAVFMIIIAGMQYVTSGGESNKTQAAKSTILQAVIGLLVIGMADLIVGFVISKL